MNRSDSITKISAALLKTQTQMGNAVKDSKNPFYKSSYADLNAIREVVLPAANANGITVLQPMKILDGRTVIETLLLHESGEWMSGETPVVVAKQNDPQAEGSGQSYARRYGLQSFFNVGAEDDDGEKGMGRAKPAYSPKTAPPVDSSWKAKAPVSIPESKLPPKLIDTLQATEVVVVADVQASPGNPTGATVAPAVEPLKKSSFRKPGKPAAATQVSDPSSGKWS